MREKVTEAIEPFRREKTIRSSLEAKVVLSDWGGMLNDYDDVSEGDLAEIFIVSEVKKEKGTVPIGVTPANYHKCGRCWRLLPEVTEDGALCGRCEDVLKG
jgi:isoleucyl-tRNA synthetase